MTPLDSLVRPRPPAARTAGWTIIVGAALGLVASLVGITTAALNGEPAALGLLPTVVTWSAVTAMYAFCYGIRPSVRSTKYGATWSAGWKTGVDAGFAAALSPIFSAFVIGAIGTTPVATADVIFASVVAAVWMALSLVLPVGFVIRPFFAVGETAITYSRGFLAPTTVPYQELNGVHWVEGGRRRSPYFVLETVTPRKPVIGQNFGEELSPRVGANRSAAERDQILAAIVERIAATRASAAAD